MVQAPSVTVRSKWGLWAVVCIRYNYDERYIEVPRCAIARLPTNVCYLHLVS